MVLQVDHAHLAINGRPAKAAELSPCTLNDLATSYIWCAFHIHRFDLQAETVVAHNIRAQQLQVSAEILIVALKVA